MKLKANPPTDVGVIVGRFQVPELHEAHKDLISSILAIHSKVVVVLGISRIQTTRTNPLDFEARKQMLEAEFPTLIVLGLRDTRDDGAWSKELDTRIEEVLTPGQKATLYGSRDSFLGSYLGRFQTAELESDVFISGTACRLLVAKTVKASPEFRAGVVWATHNRYPECVPTVDGAIINRDGRALMARKPGEVHLRFVGGYAEPESESFEDDIKREICEETGLEVGNLTYVSSRKIRDWRYVSGLNRIKTTFFVCNYVFGCPTPQDDIEELQWVALDKLTQDRVVPEHHVLVADLHAFLATNRSRFLD